MPDSLSTEQPSDQSQPGADNPRGVTDDGAAADGSRPPRRGRRCLIALAVAAVLIALLQVTAAETDYQYVHLLSGLIGLCTLLYLAYQAHRTASRNGYRLLVPALLVAMIAPLPVLLRFKHFSGEMVPRFEWRFASRDAPPIVAEIAGGSDREAVEPSKPDSERPSDPLAEAESLSFLGNSRTGVIADRQFRVPESADEVRQLWNIGVGEGWGSFAVAEGRAVTLEQRDDRECVTCYRLTDGALLWIHSESARHEHPFGGVGPRSTPAIHEGRVYAQGAVGDVWCIDLVTGEVRWKADLLELAGWAGDPAEAQNRSEEAAPWGRAGSPLLVDGLCVLPMGAPEQTETPEGNGRSLIALDATSGEVRWSSGSDQISYASPQLLSLDGVEQIVSVNESTITGHAIDTGQVLWSHPWPGQTNANASCSSAMPAGQDRLLIGKGYAGGSALIEVSRNADGQWRSETIWDTLRLLKTKFTHALVDGEIAYALSDGMLEAVQIQAMEQLWKQSRNTRYRQGQAILVDDVLVIQAESGDVALVAADPAEYRELFRLEALSSKTWNIPTVAGRVLLVRNDRQAICYLLPPRS